MVAPPAPPADGGAAAAKKKKLPADEPPELSEEDQALKDKLDLCVTRIVEPGADRALLPAALAAIADDVRGATTSMSAVPKPLKFLRAHYPALAAAHAGMVGEATGPNAGGADAAALADVLSVLAISAAPRGARDSLKYRLLGAQVSMVVGGGGCGAACAGAKAFGEGRAAARGGGAHTPRTLARIAPIGRVDFSCVLPTSFLPSPHSTGPRRRLGPRVRAQPGGRDRGRVGRARRRLGADRRLARPGQSHRAVPHGPQRG